ncbi:MAG TPA: glycoside hydrolase family 9 protein, partial [Acidobacteriota bacterium]|nr:glycoside hydrolase family 9 protein [Acidobacteriota bacterium]
GSSSPEVVDYTTLEMPVSGDHALHILAPTIVELRRINSKDAAASGPDSWDFVSGNTFNAPATSKFQVTVNGSAVAVSRVGFKRRPLYAPLNVRDLRIDNALILELASAVPANATVEVKNSDASLWPSSMEFKAVAEPMRESVAIHVNQEGYAPNMPKKAMVGYLLGNLGELSIAAGTQFQVADAATGAVKFTGTLAPRSDVGFTYSPAPYTKVMEADFSGLTAVGEYRLVVPGYGASLPFMINDGIPMAFARTYALGLYHQRCGGSNALPYTRHVHDACHTAKASIPTGSAYAYTWSVIAQESANANPAQTAPQLKDEASMLYPWVNKNPIDVSLGHHDAGDYSKYTSNAALLAHILLFAADSVPGVAQMDNLGLPESGDGIPDVLQEAKWEADFIAKLQDTDGGFYFLVYPAQRRYENNVTPDKGDPQIVWPKTTSVTAASVAALAQFSSSPLMKKYYPTEAAAYLTKAKLGWQFLMNAFAKYGKQGAYQRITHYGDFNTHDDELAWAAVEMYLATGEAQYATKIKEYFPDPSDPATFRWGWWRCYESYGNAIRSYAFATRSGRNVALDATYLAKCEAQIVAAADDSLRWSNQSAYGTSFPEETKHMRSAGWYFSLDQAMDMAVAYTISPKAEYITGLLANMNYEGGTNPVNISYLTGLGTKRQREIVHQYAQNDRRVLPQSGIPQGNVQGSFAYLPLYTSELGALTFPSDDNSAAITMPFYDRWADAYNVSTEFVHTNQGRALLATAFLATKTSVSTQAWKPSNALTIVAPTNVVEVGSLTEIKLNSTIDLTGARIVWEAREQEPAYGTSYSIQPKSTGEQWVEVEVEWPDGRRLSAATTFQADASVVKFVDDALPAGAYASTSSGGDTWNWVTASPTPYSGKKAHQTTGGSSGNKEHSFVGASSPMEIGTGDKLFAYVYVASGTTEIMLHWFDGTSWDH